MPADEDNHRRLYWPPTAAATGARRLKIFCSFMKKMSRAQAKEAAMASTPSIPKAWQALSQSGTVPRTETHRGNCTTNRNTHRELYHGRKHTENGTTDWNTLREWHHGQKHTQKMVPQTETHRELGANWTTDRNTHRELYHGQKHTQSYAWTVPWTETHTELGVNCTMDRNTHRVRHELYHGQKHTELGVNCTMDRNTQS